MTENNIAVVKGSIYIRDRKPAQIIRSNQILTEEEKLFGKILFGEFEEFHTYDYEKDTPKEKKIFQELLKFIRGDFIDYPKSATLISALKKLIKMKNVYPDVLVEKRAKSEPLYRGNITIDDDKLEAFKENKKYPTEWLDYYNYVIVPYTYKPHSPVQSWTTMLSVAQRFGPECVFRAQIPEKELVFNSLFLNTLVSTTKAAIEEDEVIRVGGSIKGDLLVTLDKLYK